MSFAVMAPRELIARKPKFGESCNRCGLCCIVRLCNLAQHVFGGEAGPCPALEQNAAGEYGCGLIAHPQHHVPTLAARRGVSDLREAARLLVNAGKGCDMRLQGETNVEYDQRMRAEDFANREKIRGAKRLWGIRR